ncbi:uncharacterized protein [Diadema setosum]|uniref:uncharacterized protein n=1 Tax=Diadema setosum TaxID=31175 RepID=UPI003B3A6D01
MLLFVNPLFILALALLFSTTIGTGTAPKTRADTVKRSTNDFAGPEGEFIEIALGDHRKNLWTPVNMTPDLKANKMSANRRRKRGLPAANSKKEEVLRTEHPSEKYNAIRNTDGYVS